MSNTMNSIAVRSYEMEKREGSYAPVETPDSKGRLLAEPRCRPPLPGKTAAASRDPAIMAEMPMKARMAAQSPSTLATIAHKHRLPDGAGMAAFGFPKRFSAIASSCHKV